MAVLHCEEVSQGAPETLTSAQGGDVPSGDAGQDSKAGPSATTHAFKEAAVEVLGGINAPLDASLSLGAKISEMRTDACVAAEGLGFH